MQTPFSILKAALFIYSVLSLHLRQPVDGSIFVLFLLQS